MTTLTYAQALNDALREEMRADPRVFIMGEDIGHHGGIFRVTKDLQDEFGPERVGRDITIVSYSRTLLFALEAAQQLSQQGVEAEVIDLRTIEPLDMKTIIQSVKGTARLLVVHESHANCGIGAEIIARVYEQAPDALVTPARRLGAKHVPIPVAEPLENAVLPQPADIVKAVEAMM
jgi:pyruvate/2-oxoglutarate/acetoin dehydrogenase E1 component